jgi:hypothetical protein
MTSNKRRKSQRGFLIKSVEEALVSANQRPGLSIRQRRLHARFPARLVAGGYGLARLGTLLGDAE